jgi:hypothetical protein
MNITNQNYRIEFVIWPLIPTLFFILYILKINEIQAGQTMIGLTVIFAVLLTLYYYLYQSQSILLRVILGLSSAVIIGAVLKIFHVKGASLILIVGTIVDTIARPVLIGLILKRYSSEVKQVRGFLIVILIIQILSIAFSIVAQKFVIDLKPISLLTDLTLLLLMSVIILRESFAELNKFIQATIKSLLLFQLTTVCLGLF